MAAAAGRLPEAPREFGVRMLIRSGEEQDDDDDGVSLRLLARCRGDVAMDRVLIVVVWRTPVAIQVAAAIQQSCELLVRYVSSWTINRFLRLHWGWLSDSRGYF